MNVKCTKCDLRLNVMHPEAGELAARMWIGGDAPGQVIYEPSDYTAPEEIVPTPTRLQRACRRIKTAIGMRS